MALNGINLPLVYAVSDLCCPLGLRFQNTGDACRITGQEYIWKKVTERNRCIAQWPRLQPHCRCRAGVVTIGCVRCTWSLD